MAAVAMPDANRPWNGRTDDAPWSPTSRSAG